MQRRLPHDVFGVDFRPSVWQAAHGRRGGPGGGVRKHSQQLGIQSAVCIGCASACFALLLLDFTLQYFALLCFALLDFTILCFALPYYALPYSERERDRDRNRNRDRDTDTDTRPRPRPRPTNSHTHAARKSNEHLSRTAPAL